MTKALGLIFIGVVIRSIYIHNQLLTEIFQEEYWVIFYIIGLVLIIIALMMWLIPLRKINHNNK